MASLLSEDVCHCILLFLDVNSYTVTQPFRISKVFNKAFNTEAFAKQFMINEFHLSESDVQFVTELFENDDEDDGDENDDDDDDSPPLKKRKMSNSKPTCFHDIFMKYCYCELKYGVASSEKYITKQLSAYATTRDSTHLSNKQMAEYLSNIRNMVDQLEMRDSLIVRWCDEIRSVYVTKFQNKVTNRNEPETTIYTAFELFGKGGYPVSIEAFYHEVLNDRCTRIIEESVKVDGNKLFSHELRHSVHGYFSTQHTEDYCLETLKYFGKFLGIEFDYDPEECDSFECFVVESGKGSSVYSYLQNAFGTKHDAYENCFEEFFPFSNDSIP